MHAFQKRVGERRLTRTGAARAPVRVATGASKKWARAYFGSFRG